MVLLTLYRWNRLMVRRYCWYFSDWNSSWMPCSMPSVISFKRSRLVCFSGILFSFLGRSRVGTPLSRYFRSGGIRPAALARWLSAFRRSAL